MAAASTSTSTWIFYRRKGDFVFEAQERKEEVIRFLKILSMR